MKEKIEQIISKFKDNHPNRVMEFWTSSEDNHEKINELVLPMVATKMILQLRLDEFEKYGEIAGCDPKGHWIKIIDFELRD